MRDPVVTAVASILMHAPEVPDEDPPDPHPMLWSYQAVKAKEFFWKRSSTTFSEWKDERTATNKKITQKTIYDFIISQDLYTERAHKHIQKRLTKRWEIEVEEAPQIARNVLKNIKKRPERHLKQE